MVYKITTATLFGISAELVEVEADVSNGLPATIIVGLPDTAVQESRERVRSAIKHSDFSYPQTRVSINLAPGDVPKIGTHFDLPIALAILQASGMIAGFDAANKLFVGELSLNGLVRPCNGALAMVIAARAQGYKEVYLPQANAEEASLVQDMLVFPVTDLKQLLHHILGLSNITPIEPRTHQAHNRRLPAVDLSEIVGQSLAKRALEIAAAGNHNVRMTGPPGSGKSMLAKAFSGILPELSRSEALEVTKLYSIAGQLRGQIVYDRPLRSPHHTSSAIALIGGGASPRPGEVTLAHKGVLFLDEFPEFSRSVLEVLRQPLEDGVVTVSRAKNTFTFPAEFILVAAQNPCPCGNAGDPTLVCKCLPSEIQKYNKKLSGPLLDRIDLHINVPRLKYSEIAHSNPAESSEQVAERVKAARAIQQKRFGKNQTNSRMNAREIKQFCVLDSVSSDLLEKAANQYLLSGRSIHRVLKVARTIADLQSQENIASNHIAEALQYRILEA